MSWITFTTQSGGLLRVRTNHIVAIYDEGNQVKLSTVAGEVHVLGPGMSVQQAATLADDAGPRDRDR
jgi:hypothetical protein